ncbi:MAG: hypothetical protein QNJ81_05765 [Acidimicrobiia bacterium]|nr:hypothetical protein [Acidimicrobiia bacterium]
MFRAIDPDGLDELAVTVRAVTTRAGALARLAETVLHAHPPSPAGGTLPADAARIEWWGERTGTNLQWRAAVVRNAQEDPLHPQSLLRVAFAREATVAPTDPEAAFHSWVGEMHRAETTAARIAQWLSQGWRDWDVTNGDLQNIKAALQALSGPQLNQVISSLSPEQLERWIAEMDNSINGFSQEEKQDLFATLAARASGESLDRISAAVAAVSDQETAADLGVAIANHASSRTIVGFVRCVSARQLRDHRYSALVPALAIAGIEERSAAAELCRLLAGRADLLELLVVDSVLAADHAPSAAHDLTTVLARGSDPKSAAALFRAATLLVASPGRVELIGRRITPTPGRDPSAMAVDTAEKSAIGDVMLELAARLLTKDPNGLIQELATGNDVAGEATSAFWRLLAERGEGEVIGHIVDRLRGGGIVSVDAFCTEPSPVPGYFYPHARNLAFAAGTLVKAFTAQAEEAKDDIDAVARTAGALIGVLGHVSGTGGVVDNAFGAGTDWVLTGHGDDVKDDIDRELARLIDEIRPRMLPPPLPGDGPPGYGGAIRAWLDTYGRLLPGA